ncbi:MAG: transcription termination factor NusA [Thermoanaerobacteraceae bacterium]|nr:transcription termination factor NusA [Thermoanaerobacteraceae bacterium]
MNSEFIEALNQICKNKGIAPDIMFEAIEAALVSAYKKNYGTSQNVKVTMDHETGDVRVFAQKVVVDNVYNNLLEISFEDALKINKKYQIGDIIDIEVTPKIFGRIAAQNAKQVVIQRIREAERNIIYEDFLRKESEVVTGIVERIEKKNVLIDMGKTEATLIPNEQIPNETYNHGDRIKVYIVEVKKTTKGPQILISRSHPGLVKRLFEIEVPEIQQGIVEIRSISREAGSRTKMAVFTKDPNIDPVGSCVGYKGTRVQAVVNELRGEKIDIVKWSSKPQEFIVNALSPAKVINIEIDEKEKLAKVIVPDYQLSLAIGKEGQNVRLAAKLTGWKIDIKSESMVEG